MRQFTARHSKFLVVLGVLLFAGMLAGAPATARAQAAGAYDKGLLWRVESAGVAPSFVFGTVHLEDKRVTTLPDPVRSTFDRSEEHTSELQSH